MFRVYIKSIGKETACGIEESLSPKKPAVQALIEILGNPNEQGQQSSYSSFNGDDSTRKIAEIHDMVRSLLDLRHNHDSSLIGQQEIGREGEGS